MSLIFYLIGFGSLFQIIKNFITLIIIFYGLQLLLSFTSNQAVQVRQTSKATAGYCWKRSDIRIGINFPSLTSHHTPSPNILPTNYSRTFHYSLSLPYYSIISHLDSHNSLLSGLSASLFLSTSGYHHTDLSACNMLASPDSFKHWRFLLGHPQTFLIIISRTGVQASVLCKVLWSWQSFLIFQEFL